MSARERKVLTGRTNMLLHDTGFMTRDRATTLNDPLGVRRPYSPEDKPVPVLTRKPFIQKNRFPTDPGPMSARRPPRTKSTAPEWFLTTMQEPTWFDQVDSKAMVDERFKAEMCRNFVERNRHRLWMFDTKFRGKSEVDVCQEMLDEMNFMKLIKVYHRRESSMDRGTSSSKIVACMDETKLSIPPSRQLAFDNFGQTMSTPRDEKIAKINRMLAPSLMTAESSHRRGALHAPDWGNFSRFNGYLAKNLS
jgi:hypothetical protein